MLTTAQLDAMTPEERTQLFETLAIQTFGQKGFCDHAATHFGLTRPTVYRWRREHNVPYAVLMALDAATVGPQPLDDLKAAIVHLVDLQAQNAKAIEQLFRAFEAYAAR